MPDIGLVEAREVLLLNIRFVHYILVRPDATGNQFENPKMHRVVGQGCRRFEEVAEEHNVLVFLPPVPRMLEKSYRCDLQQHASFAVRHNRKR